MPIERILIPTDFSETAQLAVAHGAYMAQLFHAKIFLLHSAQYHIYATLPDESPNMAAAAISAREEEIETERELNRAADEIVKKYGVELSTLSVSGKPALEIANAVKENKIDIIIMGTHGVSGFDEFFIGSNTHRVATQAECPVISVQKNATRVGFSNIILPIDNGLHSRQKVNNVIELAKKYKSTVHILSLLETGEDSSDEQKLELKLDTITSKLNEAGIPFTKKLIKGNHLAMEAMDYSGKVNGDLIVVLTGHESNITEAFLDIFTEQIVNHSKIPVMSIKPEETTLETFDPAGGTGVII